MKNVILTALLLLATTASAFASVPASRRALIIVNELDSTGIPELAPLYGTLESLTIGLPTLPIVRNNYAVIRVLHNNNATLSDFRNQARLLAVNPNIDAIDVIMALHGRDERLKWADGTVNMTNMQSFMLQANSAAEQGVVTRMHRKFRMLYNTSCFGASHRAAFRALGFDVVVGSIGVNANAEAEYPSVLGLWNLGNTFGNAFLPTNNAAALAVTDGPLVASGRFFNNFLKNVNSKKLFSGNLNVTINSDPQQ